MNGKLGKILEDPSLYAIFALGRVMRGNISMDRAYLAILYRHLMGKPLHLDPPVTLNEKIQWLKLYNRRPEYHCLVDKYEVRNYIAEKLGNQYLIPLLGVWDNAKDIDFDSLLDRFVLKCSHDSGGVLVCRDKNQLNISKVRTRFSKLLKRKYYLNTREWVYTSVRPRIIAEQYMTDDNEKDELTDYKFNCFNGRVECVMVCTARSTGNPNYYFFDRDWQFLRYNLSNENAPAEFTLPKPATLDEMFDIASKLSAGIPHIRIDLYECNGRVYFGEMTFYPKSGFDSDYIPNIDRLFGELTDLTI